MKPPPSDPFALQDRVMTALCDDLFAIGARLQSGFDRTEALRAALNATDERDPAKQIEEAA